MPRKDQPKPFKLAAAATIKADADGEGKLGTFDGNAYTGATMRPEGWWNDVIIDLAGVRVPKQERPALRQHDHEQIVGHTTKVLVDAAGIHIAGVFSGQQEHVEKVTVPAKNGFPWQLSIGAEPVRTEYLEAGQEATVNGQLVKGPLTISRETELGELSFVPLGADGNTSANIAAQKGAKMNPFAITLKQIMAELRAAGKMAKYSDQEIDEMSAEVARATLKKCMAAADEESDDDDDDDNKESKSSKNNKLKLQLDTNKIVAELGKTLTADLRKSMNADIARQREIAAACRRHDVGEIELEVKGQKQKVNLAEHAIDNDWSVDQVKAALLDHLRASRPTGAVGVPGGLGFVASQPQLSDAVLESAVFHAARHQMRLQDDDFYFDTAPDGKTKVRRVPLHLQREAQGGFGRYTDQVQQAAHDLFANSRSQSYVGALGLQMFFKLAMRAKGITENMDLSSEFGCKRMLATWAHTEPDYAQSDAKPIRAEGSSNLSIGNILANVLNKFALQGYLYTEQAWRRFCAIRSVNDFKPTKSINLLGDVMFKQLGPSGELANASLGDQAFANQAKMLGRILTIPFMHIVNDDLGILTGAPTKIGQGAGLALNDDVWTLMKNMKNDAVNGDDGNTFWRTSSLVTAAAQKAGTAYKPNKTTGALTGSTLQTAKALLDNQIDPNGNPIGFTGIKPVMLFGPSQWQTVMGLLQAPTIVYGGGAAALQPNVNMWAGYAEPVLSAYIENSNYLNSTTAYFLILEMIMTGIVEVCFLNGVDTPAVLQAGPDFQFDRPGISIRGTMPFGSNQQNFRCGVFSTGA